jgi:hypothetical protein
MTGPIHRALIAWILVTATLFTAASIASWQTLRPERAVNLQVIVADAPEIACEPAEPPMSRLGCAP